MPTPKGGYYNAAGVRLPSCTTVLGAISTGSLDPLLYWAVKLAKEGKDPRSERERAAKLGTFIHDVCERYPEPFDRQAWMSEEEHAKAVRDYLDYAKWRESTNPKIVLQEVQLVSETLQSGGTPDMIIKVGGQTLITDHKTGKHIDLPKVSAQLAFYAFAAEETRGIGCDGGLILHYGPDGLKPIPLDRAQLDAGLAIFKHARSLYDLYKRF